MLRASVGRWVISPMRSRATLSGWKRQLVYGKEGYSVYGRTIQRAYVPPPPADDDDDDDDFYMFDDSDFDDPAFSTPPKNESPPPPPRSTSQSNTANTTRGRPSQESDSRGRSSAPRHDKKAKTSNDREASGPPRRAPRRRRIPEEHKIPREVSVPNMLTPKSLSQLFGVRCVDVLKELIRLGIDVRTSEFPMEEEVSVRSSVITWMGGRILTGQGNGGLLI